MRDHLLETFNGTRNDNYTFEELITLRAHGHDVPDHWITNTKAEEEAAAAAAEQAEAIHQAEEEARAKAAAAQAKAIKKITPKINEICDRMADTKATLPALANEAATALRNYQAAYQTVYRDYAEARDLINANTPDMTLNAEGNLNPGQTGYDRLRGVFFKGEQIAPAVAHRFNIPNEFLPPRFG